MKNFKQYRNKQSGEIVEAQEKMGGFAVKIWCADKKSDYRILREGILKILTESDFNQQFEELNQKEEG